MNNKEYLIKVLENLVGHWDMASSLLQVINTVNISATTIDAISDLMKQEIKSVGLEGNTDKMTKGLAILEKIKVQESSSKAQEQGEIDELEHMLDTM